MKVGVHLPQWGVDLDRSRVIDAARAAEESNFDSVWVADHIVIPTMSESVYPYRSKGVPFSPEDGFLEASTTLAVVAGCTSRVRLGTSVLVLAMREPLLTAKTFATLDVLSAGRVELAVGAGWWAEEFIALGQHFEGRGRRMDEQIQLMKRAWSEGIFQHRGEFYPLEEVACLPLPVQEGGPPILIGGMNPAAIRRAATIGDGWHAVGSDVEQLRAGIVQLREAAEKAGRDPQSVVVSVSTGAGRSTDESKARLGALADLGVHQVVVNVGGTVDIADDIRSFGEDVLTDAGV